MTQITEKMLVEHPHLAKTQAALKKQLEYAEGKLEGYQVGRGKAGAWLYAQVPE